MRFATDDGVELHVEELGAGPPVIMLHGLLVGKAWVDTQRYGDFVIAWVRT